MKKLFAVILSLSLIISPIPMISDAHAKMEVSYSKIALGMANGIIGSTIMLKCKLTFSQPSLMIYLAGSLVYVAAEIMGGKSKAKDIEQTAKNIEELKKNMKEGGEFQKATVEAQLQSERSNLSHVQKKRKWMGITKTVYTLAVVAAGVEFILSKIPPYKPDAGACSPGVEHVPVQSAIIATYVAAQGYASLGMMGGIGVGAAALAIKQFGIQLGIGTTIVNAAVSALNSGLGRVAVFLAAKMLVGAVDGELAKAESNAQKNIADLEMILAQFDGDEDGVGEGDSNDTTTAGATSGSLAGNGNNPSSRAYALKPLPNGTTVGKNCFGMSGGKFSYSEDRCGNPIKFKRPTFDSSINIPTLTAGSNLSSDLANAIASGDMAGAEVAAAGIQGLAARINKAEKDMLKAIDDRLKKDGKKPLDVNSELNRQLAAFNSEMNKAQPGSGNLNLADIGDAATSEIGNGDDSNAANINTAGTAAAVTIPAADPFADLSGIGEGGLETDPLAGDGKVASLEDSLGDYESSENDISKKSDVSIFRQLSNRYFLNYTKIFQRKEIAPPMAEPEPTNK